MSDEGFFIIKLLIACDDNYRNSEQRRCAAVFVYERLDYIQDPNGNYMVTGINGPGNRNTLFYFLLLFCEITCS